MASSVESALVDRTSSGAPVTRSRPYGTHAFLLAPRTVKPELAVGNKTVASLSYLVLPLSDCPDAALASPSPTDSLAHSPLCREFRVTAE